ncbi:hypothetical protein, partial [Enterobacter hormaechei]|uniref:hypothetical protein n=1 Tax=Enterobacter hormaechei TaxID=158836 RepID=UPI001954655D
GKLACRSAARRLLLPASLAIEHSLAYDESVTGFCAERGVANGYVHVVFESTFSAKYRITGSSCSY